MEKGVFQHGRDVVAENHQLLESLVIESLTRQAVAEEKPADDPSARVQRHDHFRAEGIESAPEELPLGVSRGFAASAPGRRVRI